MIKMSASSHQTILLSSFRPPPLAECSDLPFHNTTSWLGRVRAVCWSTSYKLSRTRSMVACRLFGLCGRGESIFFRAVFRVRRISGNVKALFIGPKKLLLAVSAYVSRKINGPQLNTMLKNSGSHKNPSSLFFSCATRIWTKRRCCQMRYKWWKNDASNERLTFSNHFH